MTDPQIAADVDRGLAISAEIGRLKSELKQIESRLQQAALEGVTAPLEDPDREGRQFLARGTAATLPVLIESDQILGSFPAEGGTHRRLLDAIAIERGREHAGEALGRLFRPAFKFERVAKDGKSYRAALRELHAPPVAAEILAATLQRDKHGIPKSRIVIPWDRAK